MTSNPIADALKERMADNANNASPFVSESERAYIASRISLGGEYIRTESTEDGRTVFSVLATEEEVKSYNEMLGEQIRSGIYIGDENQVTFCDNPISAALTHATLMGRTLTPGPCDDLDCKNCRPDGE